MTPELFVVPAERHVERLARAGEPAETRASFRARLAAALLPDVRFADRRETRLTLAAALTSPGPAKAQLDLFAAGGGPGASGGQEPAPVDPLITTLRDRGGATWVRAVAALDDAIGALRARGATPAHLDRVRGGGVTAARARLLAAAMRALDAALEAGGARDGRLLGRTLAPALVAAPGDALARVAGTTRIRARWLLGWEPDDLAWWRALDEALARHGGYARIVLPSFDAKLEGSRATDPLDLIADAVARQLDSAPEAEAIPAVLGDLASTPPDPARVRGRVRLVRAPGALDEARVAARLVKDALDAGAAVERVAIAYPSRDERTLGPLRRALEAEGIVFHDALGSPPTAVPVVAAALHALDAEQSLDRLAVARLLRSGYVDAPRLLGMGRSAFREAEQVTRRVARALETRATAAAATPEERLVFTAAERGGEDEPAARRVTEVLARGRAARTRGERVRAARALFAELGLAARAGRGGLGTFARDEAPRGVDRAERLAVARDVRAWELLEGALDLYETTATRTGAADRAIDAEVFRLELAELLDASADLLSAAPGRAAAIRLTRLGDVAGDELDLLVVIDANEGVLPRDVRPTTLVTDALEAALVRAAPRAYVPSQPGELGARDLAALATSAAEAALVVLVTTVEDGTEAPAAPSRVFVALERAGIGAEGADAGPRAGPAAAGGLAQPKEVARRAAREATREAFFLDPARPLSDVVGALAARPELRDVVAAATGASPERPLAVTALERFAQCAFKGYASVVLSARTEEEQHELPDAREEGNLGHDALAAAFLASRDAWARRPRDREAIVGRGLEAADAVLAAAAAHAPLRAVVRLRVRESVRAVLARAIDDTEWDFAFAEQAFGHRTRERESWPAFEVDSESGERLWLRGSVDRIDRAHVGAAARVIDYKRSKSTVRSASASLGETALQVPIYAAVAARELRASATGLYLPVQPRDLAQETRSRTNPEDRVSELARPSPNGGPSEIERRAIDLVVAARAARFAPLPAKESECTYCELSGGCRKPRFAMTPLDDLDETEAP